MKIMRIQKLIILIYLGLKYEIFYKFAFNLQINILKENIIKLIIKKSNKSLIFK